jgi:hypothetical protein
MTQAPTGASRGADGVESLVIEKIMSMSRAEFENSLAALLAPASAPVPPVRVPLGAGFVTIAFEPLQGVRLGGLLELPRSRVALSFVDVARDEREAFTRRFDLAFQRGGG